MGVSHQTKNNIMLNKFKLFGIVALLATSLFMTSCSKENMLEGTWNCVSLTVDGRTTQTNPWTFNEGGSFICEDLTGNWSLSGDNLTINYSYYDKGEDYVNGTMNLNVTELKSKSLKVNGTLTERYYSESYTATISGSFSK